MPQKKENVKLPTEYQSFIHLSRYSRWNYEAKRRETWTETVDRYFDFFDEHLKAQHNWEIPAHLREELRTHILYQEIMPSMRCLMTAGPALKKENVAGYNCSYTHVCTPQSFDEILYVLMNGTGVGFSVEGKHVEKLPVIPKKIYKTDSVINVDDSKLGWAKAFRELIALLYSGLEPSWNLDQIRPAGAILKTFGGRASGPGPLDQLFRFTVMTFQKAVGRKLSSLECHDIVCKTAEVVVVGGVRRSALISLSDLGDDQMRTAKSGQWWDRNVHRALANNSANYHEIPDMGTFMKEWTSLYESKSGERGMFSTKVAKEHVDRTLEGRRVSVDDYGTNPCSEIILKHREFCNLSEVVIRPEDGLKDLRRKVSLASVLGTFQSTLTNFKYLSDDWKNNCEDERLLGVSLTGICDNVFTGTPSVELQEQLQEWKQVAVESNRQMAEQIGIKPSAAITCIKPSGTVSQLVNSASGIHPRHSKYYIRTVRMDQNDSMCKFMKEKGFPNEPDVTKPDHTTVFSFPMKSSDDAVLRDDYTAIEMMELCLLYQQNWCEHKASITVNVRENEWMEVGAWVYENFNMMSGMSFLPYSEHEYAQAPYQEVPEGIYQELLDAMPSVDWMELAEFEQEDYTVASQELACVGNSCEI